MTEKQRPSEDRGIYNEYDEYLTRIYGGDNSESHRRLLHNMRRALKTELTQRQLQMVVMYYGQNMRIIDIAQELGLEKSSVSRTLKRSRIRLARCLKYCAPELLSYEPE